MTNGHCTRPSSVLVLRDGDRDDRPVSRCIMCLAQSIAVRNRYRRRSVVQVTGVAAWPLAPKKLLPYRQRVRALRPYPTGVDQHREAGGSVARVTFGPKWLMPPVVVAASPEVIRDILPNKGESADRRNTGSRTVER